MLLIILNLLKGVQEMRISRDEKKIEAVERMKLLGIYPETIRQFEKKDIVSISEPPFGAYYWAEGEDLKRIKEFEEEHNSLVYTVIRSYFRELGKMDSYLFVSDYKVEEWEMDSNDIKHGQALAWVYDHDDPDFSEFGSIGIKLAPAAGLVRTW